MRLSRSVDMTEGPIARHLINFAAPMLIGLVFQQLYNTVDTIVVGNFVSSQALAAVGVSGPLISTLLGFFNGFSTGATVVIARCFGARDHKGVQNAVHTTILVTLLMAIVFTGAGTALAPALLRLMRAPDDMFEEASIYFRIYFEGVIGLMLYNMGAGILRAVGDSRRPLYFLIFSAIVNTAGDLIFVLVFHMGVAGVAYATILAQALSAVLVLVTLVRSHGDYHLDLRRLRIDLPTLKKIVGIGDESGLVLVPYGDTVLSVPDLSNESEIVSSQGALFLAVPGQKYSVVVPEGTPEDVLRLAVLRHSQHCSHRYRYA